MSKDMNHNVSHDINRFIGRVRRWIFLNDLLQALMIAIPAGIGAAAIMEFAAFLTPWYTVHYYAGAAVLLGILTAIAWTIWHYPSKEKAALTLDRTGLKERCITAISLENREDPFARMQREDAWRVMSLVDYRKKLPIRTGWKLPALCAGLAAVLAVSILLPSPARRQAELTHAVKKEAAQEAEKIEKVEKALDKGRKAAELTEDEKKRLEEYKELLKSLEKELKSADSKEALEKAKERAAKKLGDAAAAEKNETVSKALSQLAGEMNKDQKTQTASMEEIKELSEEARKLLDKLQKEMEDKGNLSDLSKEELEAASQALSQLSQAAGQQGYKGLASRLAGTAGQLADGSLSPDALQMTQEDLKQLENAMLAKGNSGQSGQQGQSGSNQGNGNGNGNNNGNNNGNGNGNGNGSGNGNGNGNGSGNGNGNGSGSGNGTGWNYGSKNGQEGTGQYDGEMVSIPNGTGEDGNISGRKNEGSSYVTDSDQSLAWSGSKTPYDQVVGDYSRQAMSELEQSGYPAGLQDIIKSYFEEINQ